jgi:hypothetical protein
MIRQCPLLAQSGRALQMSVFGKKSGHADCHVRELRRKDATLGKDCALDQVELEVLCHEFSDEALEIQAVPERDQPMRNTTLYYYYCTAVFFCPGP